jgi:hypothetical protein
MRVQFGLGAGASRVVIDPPGAANPAFFFEQKKIGFVFLLETNGHAEAGKSGADDGHLAVPDGGRGSSVHGQESSCGYLTGVDNCIHL